MRQKTNVLNIEGSMNAKIDKMLRIKTGSLPLNPVDEEMAGRIDSMQG